MSTASATAPTLVQVSMMKNTCHDLYSTTLMREWHDFCPGITMSSLLEKKVDCTAPVASPQVEDDASFKRIAFGQVSNRVDRDTMFNFLVAELGLPSKAILALRNNHKGMWFADVSEEVVDMLLPLHKAYHWSFDGTVVVRVIGGGARRTRTVPEAKPMLKNPMSVEMANKPKISNSHGAITATTNSE